MGMVFVDQRFDKHAQVEATFEHQGVGYTQRFKNRSSFKAYALKTQDRFISGVDFALGVTIYPNTAESYFNMKREGRKEKTIHKVAPKGKRVVRS